MIKRFIYLTISILFTKEIFFTATYKTDLMISDNVVNATSSYEYLSRYLTIWTMLITLIYYILKSISPKANKLNSYFFISIVFPLSLIVGVYYWTLQLYDPTTLQKGPVHKYWNGYDRHVQHTLPSILAVLECLIFISKSSNWNLTHFWSKFSYAEKLSGPIIFMVAYLVNAYHCYVENGEWPYPFMMPMWNSVYHYKFGIFIVVTALLMLQISRP